MDDNKIVDLFLLRDESAIKLTAEKFGSRLRSLAYGIVKDRQTAEECENDTYLKAWNSIPPNDSHQVARLRRVQPSVTSQLSSLNPCALHNFSCIYKRKEVRA